VDPISYPHGVLVTSCAGASIPGGRWRQGAIAKNGGVFFNQ